ncbi:uncharacterized protein RBU33_027511 isoform 3-T3 [Hipposideros larvatus]
MTEDHRSASSLSARVLPWNCPGRDGEGSPCVRALRPPWAAGRRERLRGAGEGRGGVRRLTPPLRAGIKPADGCWLSLGCSPLSLRGRRMTPPPPVCAALGIPRARLPSPRARSGLPLRLLLLLLGVAATTQGHPKSGPRISAIWKGGFLFEGLSDEEDDFHPSTRSTPSSSTPSSRPASLGYSGAAGPRPITQSELATALALASTPESSSHTPTPGTQGHSSGTSPMSSGIQSGTPITNDLFSQALQHALQASGQPSLQDWAAFLCSHKIPTLPPPSFNCELCSWLCRCQIFISH